MAPPSHAKARQIQRESTLKWSYQTNPSSRYTIQKIEGHAVCLASTNLHAGQLITRESLLFHVHPKLEDWDLRKALDNALANLPPPQHLQYHQLPVRNVNANTSHAPVYIWHKNNYQVTVNMGGEPGGDGPPPRYIFKRAVFPGVTKFRTGWAPPASPPNCNAVL